MRALINLLRHLTGLFIEDGSLAIAILCIVVFVALIAFLMPSESLMPGAILSFGCLAMQILDVPDSRELAVHSPTNRRNHGETLS